MQIVTRLGDQNIDLEDLLIEYGVRTKDRKIDIKIKK